MDIKTLQNYDYYEQLTQMQVYAEGSYAFLLSIFLSSSQEKNYSEENFNIAKNYLMKSREIEAYLINTEDVNRNYFDHKAASAFAALGKSELLFDLCNISIQGKLLSAT